MTYILRTGLIVLPFNHVLQAFGAVAWILWLQAWGATSLQMSYLLLVIMTAVIVGQGLATLAMVRTCIPCIT